MEMCEEVWMWRELGEGFSGEGEGGLGGCGGHNLCLLWVLNWANVSVKSRVFVFSAAKRCCSPSGMNQ